MFLYLNILFFSACVWDPFSSTDTQILGQAWASRIFPPPLIVGVSARKHREESLGPVGWNGLSRSSF